MVQNFHDRFQRPASGDGRAGPADDAGNAAADSANARHATRRRHATHGALDDGRARRNGDLLRGARTAGRLVDVFIQYAPDQRAFPRFGNDSV